MGLSPAPVDPINSPHPVPWNWVMANLAEASQLGVAATYYYRSQSLLSPDARYAAYSRIQMQVQPDALFSFVHSVLFLEDCQTGELQKIAATSPRFRPCFLPEGSPDIAGTIGILRPVAWSEQGDCILAREFAGVFSSDIASDYAVVWQRERNQLSTLVPTQIYYTNALLLGWSAYYPDRVLFQAGDLGKDPWPLWAVGLDGGTIPSPDDHPITFGQTVSSAWTGPQAHLPITQAAF